MAFTVNIFIFIIIPPSFFTWDGMNEPRVAAKICQQAIFS
ncbi:hypothetical protein NT05LI_1070 [Listeria ivanovii FSL F6-596]|nr:hypothetical protein NT05LI_1070 [Listeria ivanovii FSL F6-596]